jgi:hypothetical protein
MKRDAPKRPIPIIALFRSMAPTVVIASTTDLRNHGLAIARPLLATINRHDLASSNFMSVSSIRMNKCLLISLRECLVLEKVI